MKGREEMTSFVVKLQAAQHANDSWVCVGLDPILERMPGPVLKHDEPFLPFLKVIVDATADLVCAYKPNLGFFLTLGAAGVIALERIVAYIPDEIPIILDAKFNDIGHTARAYAQGAFDAFGVDAVTVNPYLGQDGIAPFLDRADKAAFVLARTSNDSARELQDIRALAYPGSGKLGVQPAHPADDESTVFSLYEVVAHYAVSWHQRFPGTCGLVVGATYPKELSQLRDHAPDLPFLIPGIGVQGGNLEAAVRHGRARDGTGPVVNASRGVLYASARADFADAARSAAEELRQQINSHRQKADSKHL
jgi:orotidine-5'-phosphate decarboxylase